MSSLFQKDTESETYLTPVFRHSGLSNMSEEVILSRQTTRESADNTTGLLNAR